MKLWNKFLDWLAGITPPSQFELDMQQYESLVGCVTVDEVVKHNAFLQSVQEKQRQTDNAHMIEVQYTDDYENGTPIPVILANPTYNIQELHRVSLLQRIAFMKNEIDKRNTELFALRIELLKVEDTLGAARNK